MPTYIKPGYWMTREFPLGKGWLNLDVLSSTVEFPIQESALLYPVENTYVDNTEMFANQSEQTHNYFQYVVGTDTYYEKLNTSNGSLADYREITAEEVTILQGATKRPVVRTYTDAATMYSASNQRKQAKGYIYRTEDDDAHYEYLGTRNGDATDYKQIGVPDLTGYVPYTGATGHVDLGDTNNLRAAAFKMSLTAGVTVAQGEFAWNADEETADLGLNGAVLQLGQEMHYHVRNNSGSTIPNGKPVMATGTVGASGRITIGLMDASNVTNDKFYLGITTEEIADGDDGKVAFFGKVRGIQTNGGNYSQIWVDGDVIYPDPATPGDLTNVKPTGLALPTGFIINAHSSNGTMFTRSTNISENLSTDFVPYTGATTDVDLNNKKLGNVDTFNDLELFTQTGVSAHNIGIGTNALSLNTGSSVVGIGTSALQNNTGNSITAMGYQAGQNSSGGFAVYVGNYAGKGNTGDNNILIGFQSGEFTTTYDSVGIGFQSLLNSSGLDVTAIGYRSGAENTGSSSVGVGSWTLQNNTGSYNSAVGDGSLDNCGGNDNSALGNSSGSFTRGNGNVYIGRSSGNISASDSNTQNTFVGNNAGAKNTGINNTALGYSAASVHPHSNSTLIGAFSKVNNVLDVANAKNVANAVTDVDFGNNQITITSHGFGSVGDGVMLRYTTTGSAISGMSNGYDYTFVVIDANTIETYGFNIFNAGTDTHTLTPITVINNSTVLGAHAQSTKSDQVVLGDSNVTEVTSEGYYISTGLVEYTNKNRAYKPLYSYNNSGDTKQPIIHVQKEFWNGSAFQNEFRGSIGVGHQALDQNEGYDVTGIGYSSCSTNTGNFVTAVGSSSASGNTGDDVVAIGNSAASNNTASIVTAIGKSAASSNTQTGIFIGYNSGRFNTGTLNTFIGDNSGYLNTGNYSTAIGESSSQFNKGNYSTSIGVDTLTYNVGDNISVLGTKRGYFNQGDNCTFIGYLSAYYFPEDTANAKDVADATTDVDTAQNRITITGHGFGTTGAFVNLKYSTTGTPIGNMNSGSYYSMEIIDANTLEHVITNITSTGTDTHTFTPQFIYNNATTLGAEAVPTASNQVVLGDTNVTEVYTDGHLKSHKEVKDDTTTSYTLVLADRNSVVTLNNASAVSLTIPADSSVAYPIGTEIVLINKGAGTVTVGITTDTLNQNVGGLTMAQYDKRTLIKITATSWIMGY